MTTATSTTRIPLLERDQVSPEVADVYDALLKTRGVVPNMFKTLAHTPALALATAGYLKALLSDGALPGFYKELIAMRQSVLLESEYAVKAHALSASQKGATEAQIAAARADFENGPFTEKEKQGFRAAERLHRSAAEITDDFFAELKQNFTDPQIIELIATASAFELFPRFVEALRIPITPSLETGRGDGSCGDGSMTRPAEQSSADRAAPAPTVATAPGRPQRRAKPASASSGQKQRQQTRKQAAGAAPNKLR